MSIVDIRAALESALDNGPGILPTTNILSSAPGPNGTVFTSDGPHLLTTSVQITISGHSLPALNGTWQAVVLDDLTFGIAGEVSKTRIQSTATGVGGVAVPKLTAWEGVAFATVPLVPYQRVNLIPANPENPSFGDGHSRELGIFQLTLYYPIQKGTRAIMQRAEQIRNLFKRGFSCSANGVTVNIDRTGRILPGTPTDEAYIAVVRIPYRADIYS